MSAVRSTPGEPIPNLAIATVIEVDGTHVTAELDANVTELSRIYRGTVYPIGQFGSIVRMHYGRRIIYGYVSRLQMKADYQRERGLAAEPSSARVLEADLFGEGEWLSDEPQGQWRLSFERGVSVFPLPQQKLYLTPRPELSAMYGALSGAGVRLGEHVGTGSAPCIADLNELLGKHTAVLGSTGSGKSSAVAAVLHGILERGEAEGYESWNPRIIVLDPHNEYGDAFPGHRRLSTDEGSLSLPYWLLNFQETVSLLIGKTEFVATSQANIVKAALLAARQSAANDLPLDSGRITVDSPVPYHLEDFVKHVEDSRPKQESKQDSHNGILHKLEVLRRDSRLAFLMADWDGQDSFSAVMEQFFGQGHSLRIVDLSGVPNEVAGACSAVIARTIFAMKLWQTRKERETSPLLLVCEEAHRYVPNRGEAQYEAAQDAIRRLAKEGRKYGLGLMLVSQRPSEVEATVLSQCNSWIVLRITNEADREHVRSILPDSLAGLTKVLSGLRRREAVFVGQAAVLPSRILITHLDQSKLPRSHDIDFDLGWRSEPPSPEELAEVGKRWRLQTR